MADNETAKAAGGPLPGDAGGSYEVIRARLAALARKLAEQADALNTRRKAAFGGTELAVLASLRVRTENNCAPRDIVPVGGHLLFGFNVFLGLRTETRVADVFSLHDLSVHDGEIDLPALRPDAPDAAFVGEPRFVADFGELYRYYKQTRLAKLSRTETKLLAVFRTGPNPTDLRVFRWALSPHGPPMYVDNRGERDFVFPPQNDFEWVETARDHHVGGRHPHVNVADTVFVDTIGGTLTVKIENNTEDGEGIYNEPVEDPRQALDDAAIHYARVGTLILLRVRPFNETAWRHLVYATRPRTVVRIDAIGSACVQLPEDHGIIFPGGYYLQDGQHKVFDGDNTDLEFERVLRSPNGEDVMYVFHRRRDGLYVLLVYNLIEKKVQSPIRCHGYSVFPDGRMVIFRSEVDEPTRVHPMQLWRTPFVSPEHAAAAPRVGGVLGKVGNKDLVRGISEAFAIRRLVEEGHPSRQVYEDLIAALTRTLDAHHWLADPALKAEGLDLHETLLQIRTAAELVVDEFEKIEVLRGEAARAVAEATARKEALWKGLRPESWTEIAPFMQGLAGLRALRGHLVTLEDVRFVDVAALEALDAACVEAFDQLSRGAMQFLLRSDAFTPLTREIDALGEAVPGVARSKDLEPSQKRVLALNDGLTVLSDVVGGLKVDDPTVRTAVLERISEVFGRLNRLRAIVENRRKALVSSESAAEFAAQFKLFGQAVTGAVALAATPEACDAELARLLVQLEELEARFADLEEHAAELAQKREEVYEAFTQKKQRLLDERQRRAAGLAAAGDRILAGLGRRGQAFKTADELNGFFAADPMVAKLRELAERLHELGDATRAEELLARLKAAQQDALRTLRDKLDLFEGGADLIRFGKHRFTVNAEPLELTVVPDPQGAGMVFSLTGTDYREAVTDEAFLATRPFWSQTLVSETDEVYRGEYLAYTLFAAAEAGEAGASLDRLHQARREPGGLVELMRQAAAARYDEGYERGIHDADAAGILDRLLDLAEGAGLLRHGPDARALAVLFWALGVEPADRERWHRQAASLGRLRRALGRSPAETTLAGALAAAIERFAERLPSLRPQAAAAARYLVEELTAEPPRFVASGEALALRDALLAHLDRGDLRARFEDDLRFLADVGERHAVARAWLDRFLARDEHAAERRHVLEETAALLLTDGRADVDRAPTTARTTAVVEGLLGSHARVTGGRLSLRLDEFLPRLERFQRERVPGFLAYRQARQALVDRERERLRLGEFKPRVLSSFVRNRLVSEVYLPLIGDNLAKQLGAAGEKKRTDLMGLLLLISPPGYGKTTLMEYVASRLGLVFAKVNGPALGHDVHSLDPAEAPNATARQEVEKINLAFEMGNNVMLYLDDIQHTHPELLQKFISLCDGQRRIEGVWKGRTRTYDLRGKRFCVVMAGNPYTESGERFKIPDMLANRADTYNLGDILGGREDVFALSYVENAITSNPVLAPLAGRDPADLYKLVRIARGEDLPTTDLSHGYSAVEIGEIVAVLQRLFQIQRVLLKINLAYIASASMDDRFRTEPPFKLQGSYRNMNKLAEKVVAAMTEEELDRLLGDHYVGEAQTLTSGAEQNLLKLAELRGRMTADEQARWQSIKAEYGRLKKLGGPEDDPGTRVVNQLSAVGSELGAIREALRAALQAAEAARAHGAEAARAQNEALTRMVAEARPAAAQVPFIPGHDGLPGWMLDHLLRLEQTLEAIATRKIEVAVRTEAPKAVEEMLGQQVAIVERTLIPLVRVAARRLEDRTILERKIEELLASLRGHGNGGPTAR